MSENTFYENAQMALTTLARSLADVRSNRKNKEVAENAYNPLLVGDVDEIAERLVRLLPPGPFRTPEEQAQFEQMRKESWERAQEMRYGPLPPDTYRIFEQGDIAGWTYWLQIDAEEILLRHPDVPHSQWQLFGKQQLAMDQARKEIVRRHGDAAASKATFRFMWGGSL